MLQLLLSTALMLGLGVILLLFIRALPRIDKEEAPKTRLTERWLTSELPEKFDFAMNNLLVKFLRKLRVLVLRIDNVVGERLKRIKFDGDRNGKPDIFELTAIKDVEVEKPSELNDNSKTTE